VCAGGVGHRNVCVGPAHFRGAGVLESSITIMRRDDAPGYLHFSSLGAAALFYATPVRRPSAVVSARGTGLIANTFPAFLGKSWGTLR
jgi:hypothetical protein